MRLSRPCTASKADSRAHTTAASRRSLRAPVSAAGSRRTTSLHSNSRSGSGASRLAPSVFSTPAHARRGLAAGSRQHRRALQCGTRPAPLLMVWDKPYKGTRTPIEMYNQMQKHPPGGPWAATMDETGRGARTGQQRGAADLELGGGRVADGDRAVAIIRAPQVAEVLRARGQRPGQHLCTQRGEQRLSLRRAPRHAPDAYPGMHSHITPIMREAAPPTAGAQVRLHTTSQAAERLLCLYRQFPAPP